MAEAHVFMAPTGTDPSDLSGWTAIGVVRGGAIDPAPEPTAGVWHLAECQDCTPILPMPFRDEAERDEWATAHQGGTGHGVLLITVAELVLAAGSYRSDFPTEWKIDA